MSGLSSIRTVLDFLLRRLRAEQEMEEELRSHLQRRADDLERLGISRAEAERQARIEFGGYQRCKEECREALGTRLLSEVIADVRYGLRQLRRNPGFTAVAIITLALGIGATAAIFSVADAVLIRPLPFANPSRLAVLFQTPGHYGGVMGWAVTGPDFLDWRRQSHSFTGLAAVLQDTANIGRSGGRPEFAHGQKVTTNYFDVLGVHASLGRTFGKDEDQVGQEHGIILGYSLWQQMFGGDPKAIGQKVYLNDWPYVVVGVMPANYRDPRSWSNPESDYWTPLSVSQLEKDRGSHMYAVFGRLAPGVSFVTAQDELNRIAAQDANLFPNTNANMGARVSSLEKVSLQTYEAGGFRSVRPAVLMLQIAAAMLLLVACTNGANLVLSRFISRQRELGLRTAIGATRRRLATQLLTENVILTVIAGGFGLLLAVWCKNLLVALAPPGYLPPTAEVHIGAGVLAFTFAVAVVAGILLALIPAWRAYHLHPNELLKESAASAGNSPPRARLRNVLLVTEIATCCVLLIGSGLMLRSLQSLLEVDPGFNARHFFSAGLNLPSRTYSKPSQILNFFSAVEMRIANLPGVEAAGLTSAPPFSVNETTAITAEGHAPQTMTTGGPMPQICIATPGFFRAAGISLLRGRDFSMTDTNGDQRMILVNRAFAQYFWPSQRPLGKHVNFQESPPVWREIVGVVGDVRQQGLAARALPEIYLPLDKETAEGQTTMYLAVRSRLAGTVLRRDIERQVWDVDSTIPLAHIQTGDEILGGWVGYLRYRTLLLSSFGLMTLLISAIGVYGVIAFSVAQRTREIGIRMALGARRLDVLKQVVEQGFRLTLIGLGIGIPVALALTRLLGNQLYGIKPTDPLTLVVASLILLSVALLACYIPARRAANIDPMVALKHE